MINYLGWHNWGILPAQAGLPKSFIDQPYLVKKAEYFLAVVCLFCFLPYLGLESAKQKSWSGKCKTKKQQQQLGPHTACELLSNEEVSRKQTT